MSGGTYKLEELAQAAGTSPRTVRYYVQRGLLPAPAFRGKDTSYGEEHLVRLRAIRRLQEAFLPLDAIAAELEGKPAGEIERIASGGEIASRPRQTGAAAPSPAHALPARRLERIELAPGIELTVAEDAPAASRRLFERIVKDVSEDGGTR